MGDDVKTWPSPRPPHPSPRGEPDRRQPDRPAHRRCETHRRRLRRATSVRAHWKTAPPSSRSWRARSTRRQARASSTPAASSSRARPRSPHAGRVPAGHARGRRQSRRGGRLPSRRSSSRYARSRPIDDLLRAADDQAVDARAAAAEVQAARRRRIRGLTVDAALRGVRLELRAADARALASWRRSSGLSRTSSPTQFATRPSDGAVAVDVERRRRPRSRFRRGPEEASGPERSAGCSTASGAATAHDPEQWRRGLGLAIARGLVEGARRSDQQRQAGAAGRARGFRSPWPARRPRHTLQPRGGICSERWIRREFPALSPAST